MEFDLQNVLDADGFGIAITGMTIVYSALILITVFLASLPRLLAVIARFFPEGHGHHHGHHSGSTAPQGLAGLPSASDGDLARVAAAVAVAHHARRKGA